MEVITSVKNPLIVKLKKLKENFDGKLFLDNPKTIEEAYLLGYKIENILVDIEQKDKILANFKFLNNFKRVSNNYFLSFYFQ